MGSTLVEAVPRGMDSVAATNRSNSEREFGSNVAAID
jgi:hypothetical protein